MGKLKCYLLFILYISFSSAFAYEGFLNQEDFEIYHQTISECRNDHYLQAIINKNNIKAGFNSLKQAADLFIFTSSSFSKDLQKYMSQNLISDYTYKRLSSYGFIQAVNECYYDKPAAKKMFIITMLASDAVGKGTVIVGNYFLASYFFGKVVGQIKATYPLLYTSLMWTSVSAVSVTAILELRKTYLKEQLTQEEVNRIKKFNEAIDNNNQIIAMQLLDIAYSIKVKINEKIINLESNGNTSEAQKLKNDLTKIEKEIDKLQSAHSAENSRLSPMFLSQP